ncbi:hypothetical protein FNV43_RR13700 [Rhamnella rubrinervis]|uniref:Phosphoribosyl-AMP cyclohydrolase domain-containing protein n=1 Tax=Rhamnella rubrinervis TaxID=2594499 RepID=A0A8K0H1N8_9ROSA|nr:hypothetical protein FNV43_RR13700 [Rhamnella rubrinervis]
MDKKKGKYGTIENPEDGEKRLADSYFGFKDKVFIEYEIDINSLGFATPMASSYFQFLQSGRVFPRGRVSFSRRDLNRRRTCVVLSSTNKDEKLLESLKWDDKGLVVAIAQHVDTGAILMQGFVNKDALVKTISSRKATFYSRSRSTLWTKGETSNNFINIVDIFLDCDRDSIIYLGKPDGPTCHTGSETCYYTRVFDLLEHPETEGNKLALTTLYSLESTIAQRKAEVQVPQNGKPSWTKRLLLDNNLLCSKIREEADELCRTLEEDEDKPQAAAEMADVLYHAMVLLALKDVKMEDVLQVLRHRFSQSGIEEKNNRVS